MKIFLSAWLLFLTGAAYGQLSQQLQALVNAERSFAQISKEKSTKEAFITYMSDSGFIFQSGPVPDKKFWQDAEQGTDLLTWEPVFADISSSGDLGYTTGPWKFRTKRNDPDPAGTGYYVSVWKKEKDGWKVALDIGISHPVSLQKKETLHFSSKPTATSKVADGKILKKELLEKEQEFINAQSKNDWAAYPAFITAIQEYTGPALFLLLLMSKEINCFRRQIKSSAMKRLVLALLHPAILDMYMARQLLPLPKMEIQKP